FEERLIGDRRLLVAPTDEDRGSRRLGFPSDLGGQPGLADAGLPGENRHLALAAHGSLPLPAQPVELALAADERCPLTGRQDRADGGGDLGGPVSVGG